MQASENKKIKKKKSVNTEIANTKNVRHGIWLRVIRKAVRSNPARLAGFGFRAGTVSAASAVGTRGNG